MGTHWTFSPANYYTTGHGTLPRITANESIGHQLSAKLTRYSVRPQVRWPAAKTFPLLLNVVSMAPMTREPFPWPASMFRRSQDTANYLSQWSWTHGVLGRNLAEKYNPVRPQRPIEFLAIERNADIGL
jgi:hypothetical protein